jgi:hypothetical protein
MERKTKAAILHDIIEHRLRRRKLQRLLTNDQTVKEQFGRLVIVGQQLGVNMPAGFR